jgi:high affinity Mn2+ porin
MRQSIAGPACSLLMAATGALLAAPACAQDAAATENAGAKFQATAVWQDKPGFPARYSGPNSLVPQHERGDSFSGTAFLGLRPWRGGELYLDPEVVQGAALSRLQGLGGFTNGENQKTSGPNPTPYVARAFLRQTWNLGGDIESLASDQNQLAGDVARRRLVLTAGKLAVTDIFDRNDVAADPRTRFLNWSFLTHGAYDYAADARGYTWGAALEWIHGDWALRAGRFLVPGQPNGLALDWAVARHFGDQAEMEHDHLLGGQPGKLRLLVFRDRARMSRYTDALALAAATATTPDLDAVRSGERSKRGFGVAFEQQLGANASVFARAARADGRTETYSFAEIDSSLSAGAVVKGGAWARGDDSAGVALARNGLSSAHRDYLAAGGMGFFIGDGRLRYRPETIVEAYYSVAATKHAFVTLDWQHIAHPAYNADRGPVNVGSVRLHLAY